MTEFLVSSFIWKQMMWGFEPSDSAIMPKDFFLEKKVKDIHLNRSALVERDSLDF